MRPARRADVAPFYVMEVMKAAGRREAAGGDVLHLEVGQPATGAPFAVRAAAIAALADDRLRYTDATGTAALRDRIAAWYRDRHGVVVDAGRIAVTTGASGACVLAFLAAFDVDDVVAVARPGYPRYRTMLAALGVDVVDLPVGPETGFQPTAAMVEELARAASAGGRPLRGLVVASPSNPTGTVIGPAELAALAATCRAHDVRLLVDEIYQGITFGDPGGAERGETVLAHDPDVIVLNSFSKYFSMTGWRLGWLVLPADLVEPVERLAQNLTVAPPTLPQIAALAAFSPEAVAELDGHVARYARNREALLAGLPRAGLDRLTPPEGAFYLWCDVGPLIDGGITPSSQALCASWLADLGVAVTPGIDFDPVDGSRAVRFSFAGAEADIDDAVARLQGWWREVRPEGREGAVGRDGPEGVSAAGG